MHTASGIRQFLDEAVFINIGVGLETIGRGFLAISSFLDAVRSFGITTISAISSLTFLAKQDLINLSTCLKYNNRRYKTWELCKGLTFGVS